MSPLPLFLNLSGRTVLLVGGGSTARAKVEALRPTGAHIKAVALTFREDFPTADVDLERHVRAFTPQDLEGVALVVSATNDSEVNAQVAMEARRRGVLVVAVDDPANCDATFTSTLRRGPWTLAISTEGAFAGLSRALREVLDELLPEDHDALLQALPKLRAELRRRLPDPDTRAAALHSLLRAFRDIYLLPEVTHV